MNEAAARALYEAERQGFTQIQGDYRKGATGLCAIGVLRYDSDLPNDHELCAKYDLKWGVRMNCPLCGSTHESEGHVIVHLNDHHGLTFSEIARKLGPDAA